MAYEKQEWTARETVISAERMSHIEDGIAAVAERTAVVYALNTSPSIPHGGGDARTVPTGWSAVGEEIPAVTYSEAAGGFRFNKSGVYLVALNGSYANTSSNGNFEYRVDLNDGRILAVFGAAGDVSSRSGTTIAQAAEGDLLIPHYSQTSGSPLALRPNSFNTLSIAQVG